MTNEEYLPILYLQGGLRIGLIAAVANTDVGSSITVEAGLVRTHLRAQLTTIIFNDKDARDRAPISPRNESRPSSCPTLLTP
jgi:hypothetical protein